LGYKKKYIKLGQLIFAYVLRLSFRKKEYTYQYD
jgi:hypothetical protein